MPRVSVIVPVYNVEPYLEQTLDSLSGQTFGDLEVVMVDDGSTDRSADIAAARADRDPRFRLLHQANAGPSVARNRGIAAATGELLGFLDGDDLMSRHALEVLTATLDGSGSDLVSSQVRRFSPAGIHRSRLHDRSIRSKAVGSSIRERPELFYDVTVWNKLFRRSFWDAAGLEFPPGVFYEDVPVALLSHLRAAAVDLVVTPLVYWRIRADGEMSTTQRRAELRNFDDRMAAVRRIDSELAGEPTLKASHDTKVLDSDLRLLLPDLLRGDDAFRTRFMELGGSFAAAAEPGVVSAMPVIDRVRLELLAQGRLPELLTMQKVVETHGVDVPVVRRRRRWFAAYPGFRDPAGPLPDASFDLTDELAVTARLDDLRWDAGRLTIEGRAFIGAVDVSRRRHVRHRIEIVNRAVPTRRHQLEVESVARPDVEARGRRGEVSLLWSGFRTSLDPALLDGDTSGRWDVVVSVTARGVTRQTALGDPVPGRAQNPTYLELPDARRVRPDYDRGHLTLELGAPRAVVDDLRVQPDASLAMSVRLVAPAPKGEAVLEARRRQGAVVLRFTAEETSRADGARRLRVALPTAGLLADRSDSDDVPALAAIAPDVSWDLYLKVGSRRAMRLAVGADVPAVSVSSGSNELLSWSTRIGNLSFVERTVRPVTTAVGRDEAGLHLTGRYAAADPTPVEAVLSRAGQDDGRVVPVVRAGDDFSVTVPAALLTGLRHGRYELATRRAGSEGSGVALRRDPATERTGETLLLGRTAVDVTAGAEHAVVIVVRADRADDERGTFAQRRLQRDVHGRARRRRGLDDVVLFSSRGGSRFSGSPRAVFEELVRRGDDRRHVWLLDDVIPALPSTVEVVRPGTRAHSEAAARCRVVLTDDLGPSWFRPRPGQQVVQTWRGTPVKRTGFDIERVTSRTPDHLDLLAADVSTWTTLLSANPFSTSTFRSAFRWDGPVAELGRPANDVLVSADRSSVAAAVRDRLGIPAGRRIALYAPTWRDNEPLRGGGYRLTVPIDLTRWGAEVGDDWTLVVRGHPLTGNRVSIDRTLRRSGTVVDASDDEDVADLLVAADALITDYSSLAVDFAVTGRPILLLDHDLETYRDRVRGLTLTPDDLPWPLLRSGDEVMDHLAGLPARGTAPGEAYAEFVAAYCPWDDGGASARVVDQLLGS